MSDYLSSIIARALHLEPPVRPVVPSIFESAASGTFGELQVETETAPSVPAVRSAMRPAAITELQEVAEIPAQREEVRMAVPPVIPTQPSVVREIRVETTSPETIAPAVERHVVEHVTTTERLVRERHELELRELVRETAPSPAAPVTQAVRFAAEIGARPAAALPAANTPPARPVRPGVVVPPVDSAPDPEGSVRVTIGRVEVRAVFPQATPVAAEKQRHAAVMPLEEYLKLGNRRAR